MPKIKVFIATHKAYELPTERIYQPIQVGKVRSNVDLGILADDTGENISQKNDSFCELTALYWVWKNHYFIDVDYVGLVHYRRYFKGEFAKSKQDYIASEKEIANLLNEYDGIVAKKRNYIIETIYSHYKHAHNIEDLDKTKVIISIKYPEYLPAFDRVMQGRTLSLYNMFVLKKTDFESYCSWLFDILFELEKQVDITEYNVYQKRVFGFIGERLLNVWILHQQLQLKEVRIINIEGENLMYKLFNFLKRKVIGKSL